MASPKSSRKKRVTSAAAEGEQLLPMRKGKSAAKRQRKMREPKPETGAAEDREVEFSLTEEEVGERCRERHLPQLSAGQVLALRSLMKRDGCSILKLSGRSNVGRSTISETLSLKTCPSSIVWGQLAGTFDMKLHEFDFLADLEVIIWVSE